MASGKPGFYLFLDLRRPSNFSLSRYSALLLMTTLGKNVTLAFLFKVSWMTLHSLIKEPIWFLCILYFNLLRDHVYAEQEQEKNRWLTNSGSVLHNTNTSSWIVPNLFRNDLKRSLLSRDRSVLQDFFFLAMGFVPKQLGVAEKWFPSPWFLLSLYRLVH